MEYCHIPLLSSTSTKATPNTVSLISISLTPTIKLDTSSPSESLSSSKIFVRLMVVLVSSGASLTGVTDPISVTNCEL